MQEHPMSLDAAHAAKPDHANGDGSDDDGFGDFAAADHVSHSTATAPAAVAIQSADRWVHAHLYVQGTYLWCRYQQCQL